MADKTRVAVAMSGGVDSSVAAALLVQQGYDVIGIMLRLWNEPGQEDHNRCCTPDAMALARRIAARLEIPFYVLDAQQPFYDTVVKSFLDGYTQNSTPNPCLACNRHIRWEFLLNHALSYDAQFLATGHYARLSRSPAGDVQILQGLDPAKDQSYVLHVLGQAQLQHAMFPVGEYTKPHIRQLARDFNLPVANRKDSQDLCFLGAADYREFLRRHAPQTALPGPILTRAGLELGQHGGLPFYTIGQRKGLQIAAPEPYYVLEKDAARNALIVGHLAELGRQDLTAVHANWVSGSPPAQPLRAQVKIRYKALPAWGEVTPLPNRRFSVHFDQPLRDITPGQAAVIFDGEICLGGGIIIP